MTTHDWQFSRNGLAVQLALISPQIIPPHDVNIQNSILDNLPPASGADSFEESFLERFSPRTVPSLVDGLERYSAEYYDDLRSFVYDEAMNGGSAVKIVYSAMHGVGADFLDRAFRVAGLGPVVHVKKQRGSFRTEKIFTGLG